MEGYRTGLILAAPEFDTYGCLRRFAENPDRSGVLGFEYLLRRCEMHIKWELSSMPHAGGHWQEYLKLRTGACIRDGHAQSGNGGGFMGMQCSTDAARTALYEKCLKDLGVGVDLAALMDSKQEQEHR